MSKYFARWARHLYFVCEFSSIYILPCLFSGNRTSPIPQRPRRNRQPTQLTAYAVPWKDVDLPESEESQDIVASSRQKVDQLLELDAASDGSSTIVDPKSNNPYIGKYLNNKHSAMRKQWYACLIHFFLVPVESQRLQKLKGSTRSSKKRKPKKRIKGEDGILQLVCNQLSVYFEQYSSCLTICNSKRRKKK